MQDLAVHQGEQEGRGHSDPSACPRGSQTPAGLREAVGVGLGPPCWSTSPAGNRLFASFSCHHAADKHCPGRNRAVPSSVPSAAPSMRRQSAIATNMDTPSSDLGKQCQLHSIPSHTSLSSLWDAFVILVCCTTAARWYLSRLMDRHAGFLVLLPCPQQGCPPVRTLRCPCGWHVSPMHPAVSRGSCLRHSLVPPVVVAVVPYDVLHRCQDVVKGLE